MAADSLSCSMLDTNLRTGSFVGPSRPGWRLRYSVSWCWMVVLSRSSSAPLFQDAIRRCRHSVLAAKVSLPTRDFHVRGTE